MTSPLRVVYLGDLPEVVLAIRGVARVALAGCLVENTEAFERLSWLNQTVSVYCVSDRSSLRETLSRLAPFDVGVISNFGLILPEDCLALAAQGFVNAHFGLLPENPGRNPFERIREQGGGVTGVTLHRATARPDEGPILAKVAFTVSLDKPGFFELHERAAASLIRAYLEKLVAEYFS